MKRWKRTEGKKTLRLTKLEDAEHYDLYIIAVAKSPVNASEYDPSSNKALLKVITSPKPPSTPRLVKVTVVRGAPQNLTNL